MAEGQPFDVQIDHREPAIFQELFAEEQPTVCSLKLGDFCINGQLLTRTEKHPDFEVSAR